MIPLLIIIVALGFILEALSLRRNPDMVEFDYQISTDTTEPDVPFKVQTRITNKSLLPLSYLAVREIFPTVAQLPEGMLYQTKNDGSHVRNVCRIKGLQRKKLSLETSISKRGVYLFKGDSIEFGDFLGFREIYKKVSRNKEIVVYPKRIDSAGLTDALASFCGDVSAKRYLIRDPIITLGCREYTGREPMKDINWLQSARRSEIMVREFDYTRQMSVSVILSVDGIDIMDDEKLDNCCSAARTICEKLVEKGVPVSFFTNAQLRRKEKNDAWRCEVAAGRTGGLLEGLGRVSHHACSSFEKLLEYAVRENDSAASFIVILPEGGRCNEAPADRLRNVTGQEVLLLRI